MAHPASPSIFRHQGAGFTRTRCFIVFVFFLLLPEYFTPFSTVKNPHREKVVNDRFEPKLTTTSQCRLAKLQLRNCGDKAPNHNIAIYVYSANRFNS
ncbi:MAG: hypothetical protein ACTSRN_07960, partial [Alphaproteobacteria bacterium]